MMETPKVIVPTGGVKLHLYDEAAHGTAGTLCGRNLGWFAGDSSYEDPERVPERLRCKPCWRRLAQR